MRVGAWLEVDVERPASRPIARDGESFLLGMRLARGMVITLAGQITVTVEDHRANHRIWAGAEVREARQLEGARRPMKINALVVAQGM